MKKLTKKDDEIQRIIHERFLDLKDKMDELIPTVRFRTKGIVEVEFSVKIGDVFSPITTLSKTTNTIKYNKISDPYILREIVECCDFINSYFEFLTYKIVKVSLSFNEVIKVGSFHFLCRYTKPIRTYKKKLE
ncbi:MAG: hypothetical protein RL207_589 [Bacteroidota bacterium]|jgi:hypothetical protein